MKETTDVRALAAIIAERLLASNRFATLKDTEEILVYRDGVYVPEGESYVKTRIQSNMEDKTEVSNHLVLEVLGHIQRSTLVDRSIFGSGNPHLVFENCSFNLETLTPEPFSPDRYELNKIPVTYDPAKDCPAFQQFINEILSPEDVAGIQEELGAVLRRKYLTKKFTIYLGETDTGKTTLISVFLALLGPENVSNVSIQQLGARDRFALAELYGKLANIRDDLPKDVIYSAGKIKELTGGFPVQAERKFQHPFSFTNSAYLTFTCNVLPPIEEDDSAFFNRVIIRLFTKKFGGKPQPDRELTNKLTSADELSGILNWGVRGLKRLKENGFNFTNTASLEATREDYKRRSDPVWAFVQDCLKEDSEGVVSKEKLYNTFRQWSLDRGIPLLSKDGFYKSLPEKVHVTSGYREILGEEKGKRHCFVGIVLDGENPAPPVPRQARLPESEQPEQPEQGSPDLREAEP